MQEKNEIFCKILPNGLKIILHRCKKPVCHVGIMARVGTRDEDEHLNGIAHYIEHTVFKGTAHHTARELINHIEGIGGEINAYTTKEETTFYAATPRRYWAQTLRLIGEMVTCPTFPKRETDKEVGVILDEIESYNDSPSELIYDDFEQLLFGQSSLGRPILGTKKTLKNISKNPKTAQDWLQQHYQPGRMVLFAQGDITPERLLQEAERIFPSTGISGQSGNAGDAGQSGETGISGQGSDIPTSIITAHRHTHQVHMMIGGRAYPLGHERQLALYLLNNILGGGSLNSRLNLSLREQRGLVYQVDSQYTPLSDTGYWSIYLACDREDQDTCRELVLKELHRLRENPLTEQQLRKALRQLHGQMAIAAENSENNALSMAKNMLYFGEAPSWEETFEKIKMLTPQILHETAQDVYDDAKIVTFCYV